METSGVVVGSDLRVLGKAPISKLPATGDTYAASETGSCAKQLLNPVLKARNGLDYTLVVRFLFSVVVKTVVRTVSNTIEKLG